MFADTHYIAIGTFAGAQTLRVFTDDTIWGVVRW
jgi:hypothetical protein